MPMTYLRLALFTAALGLLGCDPGNVSLGGGGDPGGGDDGPDAAPAVEESPRVTEGLALLYDFDEGSGTVVHDTSGQTPAFDLTIANPGAVQWLPGGGLELTSPTILSALGPTSRVGLACQQSGEITIEGWVSPAAVNQDGPARILTISADTAGRNLTLGQNNTQAEVRVRTTNTDDNGLPATDGVDVLLTGAMQHLLYTRDPISDEGRLYIDGELAGTEIVAGTFENWDLSYGIAVGNELTEDRPWRGRIQLLAVYCRALNSAEIQQNYEAGYSD
jgi:hypothetical protein